MVNDSSTTSPQFNEAHCKDCGARTITACLKCNASIKGDFKGEVIVVGYTIPTPTHCHGCGKPYPWKAKVERESKKKKKNKNESKPLPEKLKNSVIGGVLVAIFLTVGWIGKWWQSLPEEWRIWFVNNFPQIEFKMPDKKKVPKIKYLLPQKNRLNDCLIKIR